MCVCEIWAHLGLPRWSGNPRTRVPCRLDQGAEVSHLKQPASQSRSDSEANSMMWTLAILSLCEGQELLSVGPSWKIDARRTSAARRSCARQNRGGTERGVTGWPVTRQSEAPVGRAQACPNPEWSQPHVFCFCCILVWVFSYNKPVFLRNFSESVL